MKKMICLLLLMLTIFIFLALPFIQFLNAGADFGTKTPLTIEFIIDTKMQKEMTVEEIEKTVLQITGIANDTFYQQVNRYLAIAKIIYNEKPPKEIDKNLVLDEKVLWWLLARSKDSDFIVFLTQRPLTYKGQVVIGIGSEGGGASMISLNADLDISVNILLHEIGHNCGAQHSDDPKSIMNKAVSKSSIYDKENLKIIKENCG